MHPNSVSVGVRVRILSRAFLLSFLEIWSDFRHEPARFCADDADLEQPESEVAETHYVWRNFTITNCEIVCFL